MHVKYSTHSPHNPLFLLPISRFSVHPAATSEPTAVHDDAGRRDLNSTPTLTPDATHPTSAWPSPCRPARTSAVISSSCGILSARGMPRHKGE